jgi:DICT domain-containing protein/signal transduction histidine kinase
MRTQNSLWQELLQTLPTLRSQLYYKSTLTALSHAMEDLVLVGDDRPLVIANFQKERYYRQEARRYQRIAQRTDQVYVLAAPESDFGTIPTPYPTIALHPEDELAQEWHLVVISQRYTACLVCQECAAPIDAAIDSARQFRGVWTFDRTVSIQAAELLLQKILQYRPELIDQVQQARQIYGLASENLLVASATRSDSTDRILEIDARLFADRLVTYLQSSQYKQLRAYRTIATQERKERLINSITVAIRNSVNPEEIFNVTVREVGQVFRHCRCILYTQGAIGHAIEYEFVAAGMDAMRGERWTLANTPFFRSVLAKNQTIAIADVSRDVSLQATDLKERLQRWQVGSCLLVPVSYQQQVLGVLELHQPQAQVWQEAEVALMEAIATQVGVALMQAQAYDNLATLNQQLVDLERTQSNLIAIVGHELRTPLSTIQVCLESLFTDPDTPLKVQQIMLETALGDSERLRRLIQDFLTLSRLESGVASWQFESISVQECLDLALTSLSNRESPVPKVVLNVLHDLPFVQVDGEGLIEVFMKLLDNACKFTEEGGTISIQARQLGGEAATLAVPAKQHAPSESSQAWVEISITDTGRGIEPEQLETIFERFYQAEGYLRRTVSGTGLGLAICRRIVQKWGGTIRAESLGRMQGSTFRFTLPVSEAFVSVY